MQERLDTSKIRRNLWKLVDTLYMYMFRLDVTVVPYAHRRYKIQNEKYAYFWWWKTNDIEIDERSLHVCENMFV